MRQILKVCCFIRAIAFQPLLTHYHQGLRYTVAAKRDKGGRTLLEKTLVACYDIGLILGEDDRSLQVALPVAGFSKCMLY